MLTVVVVALIIGGATLNILAESWKKTPQGILKAIPLASVLAGVVAGLIAYFNEFKNAPLNRRGWIEIMSVYAGLFGAVGSGIYSLF